MDNLKYNGIHHHYISYIFYFRAVCYSIFHVLLAVDVPSEIQTFHGFVLTVPTGLN